MKSLEESVVEAMDGMDKELFPFLPYILQDIWEIGTDPETIVRLIQKHMDNLSSISMLDLGCGKGAVSVRAAGELMCKCHGIDALPEFIDEARKKAIEYGVGHLCKFEVGDIRVKVKSLPTYDVIVLGSIGPVLGDCFSTLTMLSKILARGGIIIIDDGYFEDDSGFTHQLIQKKGELIGQIRSSGMQLVDEEIIAGEALKQGNDFILTHLEKRCGELILRHPDKRRIFEDYLGKQKEETDVLENKMVCSTMVIRHGN
jgi:cyclopropane fatty-acyl-phospholipid synthase-like methyltransferase